MSQSEVWKGIDDYTCEVHLHRVVAKSFTHQSSIIIDISSLRGYCDAFLVLGPLATIEIQHFLSGQISPLVEKYTVRIL